MYKILTKKTKRSRHYERILAQYMNEDELVRHLQDNNIVMTGTPYIFTHIDLSDGTIITQEIMGLACSPVKLRDRLLTNK